MQANPIPKNLQELQQKVAFAENVKRITDQILAASDLDHILLDMRKEILSIFDAEAVSIFAFDSEKKEIFSKVPHIDSVEEFRIPITEQSLAGFCAKYLRPVSIADAYNTAELQSIHPSLLHDSSYDKRTGFKTKQVLTYPIVADNKYLMGVFQLLNKKSGTRFTRKDEESVAEISKALGIALFNLRKITKKNPNKFDLLVSTNRITQNELDQS
ncbi:MAG: GAF domain-containing protein, partial [Nitrospiraceae bacterium]